MARNNSGRIVRRFASGEQGNVAIIAALSVIPILTIAGFAIDFQLATTAKARVQSAVDSAVLAATKSLQEGRTEDQIRVEARNYLNAVLGEGIVGNDTEAGGNRGLRCMNLNLAIIPETEEVEGSIRCSSATTLSQVTGRDRLDFKVSSAVTYGIGKLEVAFVFDVSGSMGSNNRMTNLKTAAQEAINVLLPVGGGMGDPDDVRLSMVSYDDMVNAKSHFQAVTGVAPTRTYNWTGKVCTDRSGNTCNKWSNSNQNRSVTITNTCVWERAGPDRFKASAPGPTRWLTPVEPTFNAVRDRWEYNYYRSGSLKTVTSPPTCNDDTLVPLTSNRAPLLTYVNNMKPLGYTAGHIGTAWGWYLVTPEWNSVWPAASQALPYDEPDAVKVVILMTDGEFNQWQHNIQGSSVIQNRAYCTALKEAGVIVYTVALEPSNASRTEMRNCATSPAYAFTPSSGQQLIDAYKVIARSISDLRIAR